MGLVRILILKSLTIHISFPPVFNHNIFCICAIIRYFYAMSKGEPLPVKERVEMPVATQKNDTGLTPGLLKILHKQVKKLLQYSSVEFSKTTEPWKEYCTDFTWFMLPK